MATKTVYSCDWCAKESDEVLSIVGNAKLQPVDWGVHDGELLCASCGKARNDAVAIARASCASAVS